ncbi:cob(I)yrinic acid a,c-diamide adenosyltransferase [candidate division WWE3 bacterium]|jgi:cob(I)alamin adenosyltransferase|nr:cob(I)yrinic acid a,c-diamide adenosyltransferase [candidate division WWE3 bacterium]MBT7349411.1 cob(I)yrinic acid a,c-diamide adenosyltransferase [candidate division WWE3 bacterium]
MSVYTRAGDTGKTYLIGNTRHSKDSSIFEVLGTMDEFNVSLGLMLSDISFSKDASDFLVTVQGDLFKLGSLIANDKSKDEDFKWLAPRVGLVEDYIDELEKDLPKLENFILPGGTPAAARVHMARTVCRRCERALVGHFEKNDEGKKCTLMYINRLSDLLFVLARFLNFNENVEDIIWIDSDE